MSGERKALDGQAIVVMVLLCLIWGCGHVAIKLAAPDIPALMQAGLRSAIAVILLVGWALMRGIALFGRDGTLIAGTIAGLLFAGEFLFVYTGLAWTDASRMIVFVYLSPCVTALGLQWLVPGERLDRRQWTGMLLAFGGVVVAFADGFQMARGTLAGDACGVLGAVFWGATTVLIRATRLASISAAKTLFYQLGVSAVVLLCGSLLIGEPGIIRITPVALGSLLFQSVVIGFASYLAWFWLLTRYLAGRLSVFSFLTPLFGVAAGVIVLSEPLTPMFAIAAVLVAGGIVLVNNPAARRGD